jgi:hypothetical protein
MSDPTSASSTALIELLYWPGCPSHERAQALIENLMAEFQLDPATLQVRVIATLEEAIAEQFVGSPTVRINGRDLLASTEAPSLTCRLYYRRDGRPSALPDPEDLRDALSAVSPSIS